MSKFFHTFSVVDFTETDQLLSTKLNSFHRRKRANLRDLPHDAYGLLLTAEDVRELEVIRRNA